MPVLPASVRVALWATEAFSGRLPLEKVGSLSLPDIDDISGLTPMLQVWRDVGERVVMVALPRPGSFAGMPTGPASLSAAAQAAEEVVFVPGLGGALVPEITEYGPREDRGWRANWTAYPSDPLPAHVAQALDLADVQLRLRTTIAEVSEQLSMTPGSPLAGAATELMARRRLQQDWGMPSTAPRRATQVIELAGSVLAMADIGLDDQMQSIDSSNTQTRERLLRALHAEGVAALVTGTNVAVQHMAGWR